MTNKTMVITTAAGVTINTENTRIAAAFLDDGASVEDENGTPIYFQNIPPYCIYLTEHDKISLIAHWEKTGMFGSIVSKIRDTDYAKRVI